MDEEEEKKKFETEENDEKKKKKKNTLDKEALCERLKMPITKKLRKKKNFLLPVARCI